MSCRGMRLPFDIASLYLMRYALDASGSPTTVEADRDAVRSRLVACKNPVEDSPLFQLLTDWPRPDITRLKTDTFRESMDYSQKYKARLAADRDKRPEPLSQIESELDIPTTDPAIVIDLFLSHRAAENWSGMVDLVSKMSFLLARSVLVREQTGSALNRLARRKEGEEVLLKLIEERGPSSETNGILGRVYKDSWKDNRRSGNATAAIRYLRKAISAYVQGFEADWRDAYPDVNTLTLMEINEPLDPRQAELLPVVHYSVKRRRATKRPDYWDHAALLELAVLDKDRPQAESALADAIPAIRESWEPRSTANNLGMIREKRSERGGDVDWILKIETSLEQAARAKDIHPLISEPPLDRRNFISSLAAFTLTGLWPLTAAKEKKAPGPVLVEAGRRVDPPGATVHRFPPQNVANVQKKIEELLRTQMPAAIVSSAACGADLLLLEAANNLHLPCYVLLPSEPEEFRQSSVTDRPGGWGKLYTQALHTSKVEILKLPKGQQGYLETNIRLLDRAQALAEQEHTSVNALVVWNRESRGPDDVTAHFLEQAKLRKLMIFEISTLEPPNHETSIGRNYEQR